MKILIIFLIILNLILKSKLSEQSKVLLSTFIIVLIFINLSEWQSWSTQDL